MADKHVHGVDELSHEAAVLGPLLELLNGVRSYCFVRVSLCVLLTLFRELDGLNCREVCALRQVANKSKDKTRGGVNLPAYKLSKIKGVLTLKIYVKFLAVFVNKLTEG